MVPLGDFDRSNTLNHDFVIDNELYHEGGHSARLLTTETSINLVRPLTAPIGN